MGAKSKLEKGEKSDIKPGGFMGATLFGDSHRSGTVPVQIARILRAV